MSQEIIYTSSPEGLRPGSFGFCTVATTPGMATSLAERLEALSGYRHAHPPGHPRAQYNPVVFSHLILKVGGQKLHVLSRIADAGLDYSQRTNKLAHHVALGTNELSPAGPAWVLDQSGFAETAWSGTPRILPAGRKPPAGNLAPQICMAWERITGDAGWAGVLAQHALDAKRPAHIVFPEGTDVLALLVEAQSLLPPARRWEVSFSTYFTRLPAGVECLWRCVLAGSPEATAATRLRGETVIDLTQPMGAAADGPLVQAARTSKLPKVHSAAALSGASSTLVVEESEDEPIAQPQYRLATEDSFAVAPPPIPRRFHARPAPRDSDSRHEFSRGGTSKRRVFLAVGLSALVLIAFTVSIGVIVVDRSHKLKVLADAGERTDEDSGPSAATHDGGTEKAGAPPGPKAADVAQDNVPSKSPTSDAEPPAAAPLPVAPPPAASPTAVSSATAASTVPSSPAAPPANPQERTVTFKKVAKIPRIGPVRDISLVEIRGPTKPAEIQLDIAGKTADDFELTIRFESESQPKWLIERQSAATGVAPGSSKSDHTGSPVAEISVNSADDRLHFVFNWRTTDDLSARNLLLTSMLVVDIGGTESHVIQLGEPLQIEPISFTQLKFEKPIVANNDNVFQGIPPQRIRIEDARLEFAPAETFEWKLNLLHQRKVALELVSDPKLYSVIELDVKHPRIKGYFAYDQDNKEISRSLIAAKKTNIGALEEIDRIRDEKAKLQADKKEKIETDAKANKPPDTSQLDAQISRLDQQLQQTNAEEKLQKNNELSDRGYRKALKQIGAYLGLLEDEQGKKRSGQKGEIRLFVTVTRVVNAPNGQEHAVIIAQTTGKQVSKER